MLGTSVICSLSLALLVYFSKFSQCYASVHTPNDVDSLGTRLPESYYNKESEAESDIGVLRNRIVHSFMPSTPIATLQLLNSTLLWTDTMLPNGTWADVDYHPAPVASLRNTWPPLQHVLRLASMATCYASKNMSHCYRRQTVFDIIVRGLEFWFQANLTNSFNWYQNEISVPIGVGQTCVLLASTEDIMQDAPSRKNGTEMSRKVPPALLEDCIRTATRADWNHNPPGMTNVTGANLVWMATAHVYQGILAENQSSISTAVNRIFGQLYITKNHTAGFKEDGSFFQHDHGQTKGGILVGPFGQLYNGGYGAGFTEYMINWVLLTNGTVFELDPMFASLLSRFLLAQNTVIVGSVMPHWDISVIGRELARPNHRVSLTAQQLRSLATLPVLSADARHAVLSLAHRLEGVTSGRLASTASTTHTVRAFWKADYIVSTWRNGYTHTLRMFSDRTLNTECIAEENKLGKHMGAGALYTYHSGAEYNNSFPLWDWQLVPGTTVVRDGNSTCMEVPSKDSNFPPSNNSCWVNCPTTYASGETSRVGVLASAGNESGMAMFDFVTPRMWANRIRFRKSWFFDNGGVMVLGSGIERLDTTPAHLHPLTTALEQRWLVGDVVLGLTRDGRHTTRTQHMPPNASITLPAADGGTPLGTDGERVLWIAHDGTVLVLGAIAGAGTISPATVTVSTEHKRGDWAAIGVANGIMGGNVFAVHLTHADSARGGAAGLAYAMLTGVSADDAARAAALRASLVLSRSAAVHAVLQQNRTLAAAFFTAGAVAVDDWGIRLTAHQPCSVLLSLPSPLPVGRVAGRTVRGWATLSIADPTQSLQSATIAVTGRHAAGITIDLPQGEHAGSAAHVILQ
eukprot:m.419563 g.419563  ORF g.419563 m.419563 type:complete len:858 (-) comp21305_c0_seq3:1428-4001(-)